MAKQTFPAFNLPAYLGPADLTPAALPYNIIPGAAFALSTPVVEIGGAEKFSLYGRFDVAAGGATMIMDLSAYGPENYGLTVDQAVIAYTLIPALALAASVDNTFLVNLYSGGMGYYLVQDSGGNILAEATIPFAFGALSHATPRFRSDGASPANITVQHAALILR